MLGPTDIHVIKKKEIAAQATRHNLIVLLESQVDTYNSNTKSQLKDWLLRFTLIGFPVFDYNLLGQKCMT